MTPRSRYKLDCVGQWDIGGRARRVLILEQYHWTFCRHKVIESSREHYVSTAKNQNMKTPHDLLTEVELKVEVKKIKFDILKPGHAKKLHIHIKS